MTIVVMLKRYPQQRRCISVAEWLALRLRCERTQIRIILWTVVFIETAAEVLGTGCAPLLQCLGRLSLPPSVGR